MRCLHSSILYAPVHKITSHLRHHDVIISHLPNKIKIACLKFEKVGIIRRNLCLRVYDT